jgi:hypothetical protein
MNIPMDVIHYSGGSFMTGTDIAEALLAYARALAANEDSATVNVPTRQVDGALGRAQFLIGPASQIVSETVATDLVEVIDRELVARLTAAADGLGGARALPVDSSDYTATTVADLEFPDTGPN